MQILLFEPDAHLKTGHQGVWPFNLATEMQAQGHDVHVLTTDGMPSPLAPSVPVHGIGASTRAVVARTTPRMGQPWRRGVAHWMWWLALTAQQAAWTAAVRSTARRLGPETVVVALGMSYRFSWAAVLAPRRSRWVVYEFNGPPRFDRFRLTFGGGWSVTAACDRRRRAAGGGLRLAVNNETAAIVWEARHPWARPVVIPSATRRRAEPIPREEALRALRLPTGRPIALHLGHARDEKSLDVVFEAFAGEDPPCHLVLAGAKVGARFLRFRSTRPELSFPEITIRDGFQSEADKGRLYSAADLVVLAFSPGTYVDSGSLSDAVSYHRPTLCTSATAPGDLVEAFGVGEVYAPHPAALRSAACHLLGQPPSALCYDRYLAARDPADTARRLVELAATSS